MARIIHRLFCRYAGHEWVEPAEWSWHDHRVCRWCKKEDV